MILYQYFVVRVILAIWACNLPRGRPGFLQLLRCDCVVLWKNLNAPRPSEHPPVRGGKCQNV